MIGLPGADSAAPVNSQISGQTLVALATSLYGTAPAFWGRYFTSPSTSGMVEYRHRKENRILSANGIRLLPIARQTSHVDGTHADGSLDAQSNAEDILATFPADYLASLGGRFFVFLDVEGAPSLSAAYYGGWALSLGEFSREITDEQVELLPCVYASRGDVDTWESLADSAMGGVPCFGAWVARWRVDGCSAPLDWDDELVRPAVDLPCDVLLWQYAADCHGGNGFDCDQSNPSIDAENDLLRRLILPPPDQEFT
jgi:hypothetical protein